MTPEEIEAKFAEFQRRINDLTKRIDDIGAYAGATEYKRCQDALVADRRLKHLEDGNEAKTTP